MPRTGLQPLDRLNQLMKPRLIHELSKFFVRPGCFRALALGLTGSAVLLMQTTVANATQQTNVFAMGDTLASLDFVNIGNPGNPNDTNGFGGVATFYRIGRFEVTAAQYGQFLNAVAQADPYGLYHPAMGESGGCGIQRLGSPGSYAYQVELDWANRPVNHISWARVARFVNWLANGQPAGPQDATTTEDGTYELKGATQEADLLSVSRKPGSRYFLPTENEWHKAAYHKNDGVSTNYWNFPMSSNAIPKNVIKTNDVANSANYTLRKVVTSETETVTNYTACLGAPYYRTPVGEFENSASPYGTYDQGGNVWEWTETVLEGTPAPFRGARGGSFASGDDGLRSSYRPAHPPIDLSEIGFRIAALPALPPPSERTAQLLSVKSSQDGRLRLEASVPSGQRCVVQESNDLARWTDLKTAVPLSAEQASLEIASSVQACCFYRLARPAGLFRLGPQRRAATAEQGPAGTNITVKWKFKTGAGVLSSPVLVGRIIYIGSLDDHLYALDADSGTEKWHFPTGGDVRSTPAVIDGQIYCYSRDGLLYALNAENGHEIWRRRIAATNQTASFDNWEYFDSSPAVVNGIIYIGSGDKSLYAIEAASGLPLWNFYAKSKVSSPPAVVNGVVYFGVTDGNFYALEAGTGALLWKYKTQGNTGNGYPRGDVLHAPVVVNGTVFFGSRDSAVYALDTLTGARKWRTAIMGGYNWAADSPAVWDEIVYMGSSITGALTALDAKTGKQKWKTDTYQQLALYSSVMVAGGVAYFGTGDVTSQPQTPLATPNARPGYLQAIDATTGKNLWRVKLDGHVWSSPLVANQTIYFGCMDGHVYAMH